MLADISPIFQAYSGIIIGLPIPIISCARNAHSNDRNSYHAMMAWLVPNELHYNAAALTRYDNTHDEYDRIWVCNVQSRSYLCLS